MFGSKDRDPIHNTLGFRSAVIASLVLSFVSFLTTWSGLRAADPVQSRLANGETLAGIGFWEGAESLAITLGLSFGIQALMLALAWVASRLIMVEFKKNWLLIGAILLGYFAATSISVTFSYIDLFDRMFNEQKSDWSTQTIRERGDVMVEELLEDLETEERKVRSEFASQQATFQAQINLLSDASTAQRTAILAELDGRKAELRTYKNKIGSERAEARRAAVSRDTRIQQLEDSVADFETRVAALKKKQAEIQVDVDDLEAQSRAKADEKLLEERGAQESGAVGRGPVWRELDREHDIIKANLEVAQNRLDRVTRELDNASEALLNGREQLAIIRSSEDTAEVENALNANNDVRVAFLQEEINALQAQADALDLPVIDFGSERLSEEEINQIENACTQIKSELIAAQSSAGSGNGAPLSDFKPSAIDCTSGGAFDTARNLFALQDSIDNVEQNCRANDSETYASLGGSDLINYIRGTCINESALSARAKQSYLEDLRRIARTRDPNSAPIAYAFVALQDREAQAIFAFCLAAAADLLILIVSLFGNAGNHHIRLMEDARAEAYTQRRERQEPALFDDTDEDDPDDADLYIEDKPHTRD